MQRVKTSTAVSVLPSPAAGGTPGFFALPNPAGGVAATVPNYDWYNNIQEEICYVIEQAGIALADGVYSQLRQAITKMVQAGQRAVVINSATFAPAVTGVGKAVYWDTANSRFDLALADGSAKQNMVGFADVPNGFVYAFGDAVLFSGLTPGSRYYLDSATAGAITTTVGSVFVGIARNATEVFVDIDAAGVTASSNNTWTKAQRGAFATLTSSGGSIAVDFSAANNYQHTLTENTTLATPSNVVAGQSGAIYLTQHASAAKTLAFSTFFKFPGGIVPALTTTLSAVDVLVYTVDPGGASASCQMIKDRR